VQKGPPKPLRAREAANRSARLAERPRSRARRTDRSRLGSGETRYIEHDAGVTSNSVASSARSISDQRRGDRLFVARAPPGLNLREASKVRAGEMVMMSDLGAVHAGEERFGVVGVDPAGAGNEQLIRLAVVWYLFPDETHNNDGRTTRLRLHAVPAASVDRSPSIRVPNCS
jgi:hypothetical protein